MNIVYLNGHFIPEDRAAIPVTDRGFLFGDGVFTTLKIVEGQVQCWPLHLQRLYEHCTMMRIEHPLVSTDSIHQLLVHNHALNGTWRLKIVITGGDSPALNLSSRAYGNILMSLKPYQATKDSYRLTVFPYPISSPLNGLKSLAYLDRTYVSDYALQKGFDDALVLDKEQNILETAFSNIFWRVGNQLIFPNRSLPILSGIALRMVDLSSRSLGFEICDVYAQIEHIPSDAQVFICNSLKDIIPVISIDHRSFSRDLIWEKTFKSAYFSVISQNSPSITIN